MGSKNKKKLFTGNRPIGGGQLRSRRVARQVTSQYHLIRNELDLLKSTTTTPTDAQERIRSLEQSLEELGGTNKYQEASMISTKHFKTSRWVLQQIHEHVLAAQGLQKMKSGEKLRLLEVGAINIDLQHVSHLSTRAIDLHSQHAKIETMDFFALDPAREFDVVVCSMVVNCVTEAGRRGEMLARLAGHLRTHTVPSSSRSSSSSDSGDSGGGDVLECGILLLALPSRCLASPYVQGRARFVALLAALGLSLVAERQTPKVTFLTLRLAPTPQLQPAAGKRHKTDEEEEEWKCAARLHLGQVTDAAPLSLFRPPSHSSADGRLESGASAAPAAARNSSEFSLFLPDWLWPQKTERQGTVADTRSDNVGASASASGRKRKL